MELAEEQSEKHSWECYATEWDNSGTECVSPCRWHRVLHHLPEDGPAGDLLQQADRASPFNAVGEVVGTLYWSALTYGAVTIMQVVGHKKGLFVMERVDPMFLLMDLPNFPVLLVLGKMICWEDYLVRLWSRRSYKHRGIYTAFIR